MDLRGVVGGAPQDDLRRRQRPGEQDAQRDRPAAAHLDGRLAVGALERPQRGGLARAAARQQRARGSLAWRELDLGAPRGDPAQVGGDRRDGGLRVLAWRQAGAEAGAGARHQGVGRAVDRGRVQPDGGDRGPGVEPLGDGSVAHEPDAVQYAAAAAHRRLLDRPPVPALAHEPVHRHVARRVVQRGQHPGEGDQRVGRRAAEEPGVHGARRRPQDLHVEDGQPAQRRRQRRLAGAPVARVGHHDHVGRELLGVRGQVSGERPAAGLLLALHDDLDADGRRAAERPQRAGVQGDPGLVVGGAAAVEAPAALGRLPRR